MWQDILVFLIIVAGAATTLRRFYAKFTEPAACCGEDNACAGCRGGCGGGNSRSGRALLAMGRKATMPGARDHDFATRGELRGEVRRKP